MGNEGLFKIAEKFGDIAEAKTIIGYAKRNKIYYFEGSIKGRIVSPKGIGFGWDSIFQPKGFSRTFGEMNKEEKNKISMRAIAFRELKEFISIS